MASVATSPIIDEFLIVSKKVDNFIAKINSTEIEKFSTLKDEYKTLDHQQSFLDKKYLDQLQELKKLPKPIFEKIKQMHKQIEEKLNEIEHLFSEIKTVS